MSFQKANAPNSEFWSLSVDPANFQLTKTRIILLCSLLLSLAIGVIAVRFAGADELVLSADAMIGGDFIAFFTAAKVAAAGNASALFSADTFQALLVEVGPAQEKIGLTWQYPPTYLLILAPLSLLGYAPAYAAWTGGTAAAYFASLRCAGFRNLFLFVILAAPVTYQAVITGQNGFLTAALLAMATLFPDRRPIVAGIAAALLTVKPQLGVLIPFAYLAAGCWRAFFTAALGAAIFAAASVAAYGLDTWFAFFEGARTASANMANAVLPLFKMATPFATIRHAGAPAEVAFAVHGLVAVATIMIVSCIWRRVAAQDLKAAALCAGVFLVAPYGYYYELIILALPAAILARRGLNDGWLPFEQHALVVLFLLPMALPGEPGGLSAGIGLVIVVLMAASVMRRVLHETPCVFATERVTCASAKSRPQSG